MIINGKLIALEILDRLKKKVSDLEGRGVTPTMAVILIGDVQSSNAYVRQKELRAKEIGAEIKIFRFEPDVSENTIEDLIKELDSDRSIHGVILQRPIPKQLNAEQLENLISPEKEIDGFGKNSLYKVPVAAAVEKALRKVFAYLELGEDFTGWLKTKNIIVLGKGETAGQPIINWLKKSGIEPNVIDSKTINAEKILNAGDIIISAVGKRGLIKNEVLKNGVILIGVGLSTDEEGKTKGDYNEKKLESINAFYTPTPGGIGPINVALLMQNLVQASENLQKDL